ncbi:MAG: hypothetical protein OXD37_01655 [Acidimicrobiaceae bacterium]|nr:hypothetical protein [Acidimicrobiaceae bacterium]
MARNRGSDGGSNAVEVQNPADQRALRPKTLKLAAGLERAAMVNEQQAMRCLCIRSVPTCAASRRDTDSGDGRRTVHAITVPTCAVRASDLC